MSQSLRGGCHCRQVRYEADGQPFYATVCHCTMCRGTSGAPMVAWFSVKADHFRFVQGEPRRYRSSPAAWPSFCGNCGTQLTFQTDGSEDIDITTASLDEAEAVPPADQTFGRSRLRWVVDLGALAVHVASRP